MDLWIHQNGWQVVMFVLNIAFLVGFYFAKLKDKPDKEDVRKMISDNKSFPNKEEVRIMIRDAFTNHCPLADRLESLEGWREKRVELLSGVKEDLQAVRINVEMICESLGLKYKE